MLLRIGGAGAAGLLVTRRVLHNTRHTHTSRMCCCQPQRRTWCKHVLIQRRHMLLRSAEAKSLQQAQSTTITNTSIHLARSPVVKVQHFNMPVQEQPPNKYSSSSHCRAVCALIINMSICDSSSYLCVFFLHMQPYSGHQPYGILMIVIAVDRLPAGPGMGSCSCSRCSR
jgi:hypothetical protein